jgi:flagellar basal body P-ring formation protein FlgA
MRCSHRSTTWSAERLATLWLTWALLAAWPAAADRVADPNALVEAAIRRAVAQRLGSGAEPSVHVGAVQLSAQYTPGDPLLAVLEPAARAGSPIRVGLVVDRGGRRLRVGQAEAVVRISVPHARARTALIRGATLGPESVDLVTSDIGDLPLRPLPRAVAGGRLVKPLSAGEVIVASAVSLPPLVRSGEVVVVRVVGPGLDVRGRAIAVQSGALGDRIRVVNPESGRALQVRVVGPGEVEVIHGA